MNKLRTSANNISLRHFLSIVTILFFAMVFWLQPCAAQDNASKSNEKVLALVDGKPITEAEIRTRANDQLEQLKHDLETREYEIINGELQLAIQNRLVEIEAAKRGVTPKEVLAGIKASEVTDADVDKFYEENKSQIPKPKEEVAPQIKQYLQQKGQADAQTQFYAALESKYKVDIKLEPMRTMVAATGPALGPAAALVTIVEFSDFQCPYCSRLFPTMQQVMAKYGDKVRIVFRQYPLPFHANAQKAAEASLCANEQGKFWEMHDAMFKNQNQLAVENLKSTAVTLGLNAEKFNSCLDSNKFVEQINADKKEGTSSGVSGTPAMFINGRFISGAVPLEQITSVVDDELRRKGGK